MKIKAPVKKEKCLTITTTHCEAEVKSETVELCVYVYEKKKLETMAKVRNNRKILSCTVVIENQFQVPEVKYTKECKTEYATVCQKKSYGYGKDKEDCKEVLQEKCFNNPEVS